MADAPFEPVGTVWSSRHITWSRATIFVESLQVDALVGGDPHGTGRPQPIFVDLKLLLSADFDSQVNAERAAIIDYEWAVQQVIKLVGEAPSDSLETLARRIADTVLGHPLVDVVKLQISKLGSIPGVRVGVQFEADRAQTPEHRVLL